MANGGIIGPVVEPTLSTVNGGDKITTFTSSGTFTVSKNNTPNAVHYLVVAGGGNAGAGGHPGDQLTGAGGGGAGGYRTSWPGGTALTIPGSTPVTVGGSGSNSTFGPITSNGGGFGGDNTTSAGGATGGTGGSSGGCGKYEYGSRTANPGNEGGFSPPEGNPGGATNSGGPSPGTAGCSAGGGGAGAPGASVTSGPSAQAGNGGNGTANSISGSPVTYAGGGGGVAGAANLGPYVFGTGGTGGGGTATDRLGAAGTDGLGGGASGAAGPNPGSPYSNVGGSGVVIAREEDCVYVSSGIWSMNDVLEYRRQNTWAD